MPLTSLQRCLQPFLPLGLLVRAVVQGSGAAATGTGTGMDVAQPPSDGKGKAPVPGAKARVEEAERKVAASEDSREVVGHAEGGPGAAKGGE